MGGRPPLSNPSPRDLGQTEPKLPSVEVSEGQGPSRILTLASVRGVQAIIWVVAFAGTALNKLNM